MTLLGKPAASFAGDRPISLLAYLLLHRGTAVSRQHLAFTLWPDSSGAAFERDTDEVITGKVAGATARLMQQRPLVDFAISWIETHRTGKLPT